MAVTAGRNDPCPCGSGKKYKNCCLGKNQAKPVGLKGRKFTAKVLTAAPAQQNEAYEQSTIKPVDYNALMERSFGEALNKYPEKPPIPENPDEYLVQNDKNVDENSKK